MCMVPLILVSKGPDKVSWTSLPGSDAAKQAQTGQREDVLQGVFCRGPPMHRYNTAVPQSCFGVAKGHLAAQNAVEQA
jgi:hypothetical protein